MTVVPFRQRPSRRGWSLRSYLAFFPADICAIVAQTRHSAQAGAAKRYSNIAHMCEILRRSMDPIANLLALEAIRALKARYFRCVDLKDWDGLAKVFAADIAFDRTFGMAVQNPWTGQWTPPIADAPVIVRGREAVIEMVRAAIAHVRTVHQGFMSEIEVESADTARGIWAMRDEIYDRAGRLIVSGSGHYHETYERLPSGWVIKTSKLTRLWLTSGDARREA